jgi:hypothetical protein
VNGNRKSIAKRWLGCLWALTIGMVVSAADTDIKLETVTADGETYSNVVVFSKSATHVSICLLYTSEPTRQEAISYCGVSL